MAASRTVINQTLNVDGSPLNVTLIENPTIEDVLITEVEIQASAIDRQDGSADNRSVDRNVLDFLIRLGVSR